MVFKPDVFVFNGGKSQTVLNFSPINEAYLVYRQDGTNQGNVRIHPSFDEAKRDYDNRVDMIKQMGEIDDTVL